MLQKQVSPSTLADPPEWMPAIRDSEIPTSGLPCHECSASLLVSVDFSILVFILCAA